MTGRSLDRRRLLGLAGATGLGLAGAGLRPVSAVAAVPTEQELAFANFSIAAEYLMHDFYAKAVAAKLGRGAASNALSRAGFNEGEHITAFTTLLQDAGQTVPAPADFAFSWGRTFRTLGVAAKSGLKIENTVVGVYLTAATTLSEPSYRTLFASALAIEAQHVSVLAEIAQSRPLGNSFPVALDLETATGALDPYLG